MEENEKMIESLLEKAADYGKTTFELVKLKALEKTSEVVSTLIPHSFVFVMIAIFMLFLNLGLAFWLGDFLGKTYYGFLVVAAFYGIIGIFIRLFLFRVFKKLVSNYIIKHVLK
jgi:hypothetical protein